jgi:hypothetical protein
MADVDALGATYRTSAEKAKSKTLAFAVLLVLAHLLELRPSEISGAGLKFTITDPVVIYGGLALLFLYNFSRFISESQKGEYLLPLSPSRHKLRGSLRSMRSYVRSTRKRGRPHPTPKDYKDLTRSNLRLSSVVLLPYRVAAVLFVMGALVLSISDLMDLGVLVWTKSPMVQYALDAFR